LEVNNTDQYFIGGRTKLAGIYTAQIFRIDLPLALDLAGKPQQYAAPVLLKLKRGEIVTQYPYTYLLPLGAATSVFGLFASVWSVRSKPAKYRLWQRSSHKKG